MKRLETDGGVILWIFFTCVMSKVVMLSHVRGWSRRRELFRSQQARVHVLSQQRDL